MAQHLYNKRDPNLDLLKGIGILLVVYGHTVKGLVQDYIYLFHMPLFFFLSGASLNYSKNLDLNIVKRFKHIMVPYFFFSGLCFLYWNFVEIRFRPVRDTSLFSGWFGAMDYKLQQFTNIFLAFSVKDAFLYNVVLWFLPCLFITMIVYLTLRKWGGYGLIGIVLLVSIAFVFSGIRFPWCSEIAFVALPFIFGGELLFTYLKRRNHLMSGSALLCLSIILFFYLKPHIRMGGHEYGEWYLFYLVAFSIILSLCVFSRYLVGRDKGILEWLGRNSLAIMCIHEPVKRIFLVLISKLLEMEIPALRESAIISLGITIFLMLILIPIILSINRYIPYVLGKEKR